MLQLCPLSPVVVSAIKPKGVAAEDEQASDTEETDSPPAEGTDGNATGTGESEASSG